MDMEKVIKGLEQCTAPTQYGKGGNSCTGCPYLVPRGGFNQFRCNGQQLMKDAIALLKEQEAVEPIPYHRSDGTIFKYECRQCRTKIFKMDLFCRHCGRQVKWE